MASANDDRDDGHLLHRLVFFSDAVFAIVLTLLVLELRPPELASADGLVAALGGMARHFIAFFASFAVISIFWAGHMAMFRPMRVFDWLVTWLNLLFLFTIALMPFASAILGEYGTQGEAWRIYSVLLIAASVAQSLLVIALYRGKGRLVGGATGRQVAYRLSRAASPGIVFGVGLGLSLIGQPGLSAMCWALFPPVLFLAQVLFGPRKARPAATAAA
ncbi:MAG: TMEM175 family protein [Caulobacter sp.]